jgi:hypothetical protein
MPRGKKAVKEESEESEEEIIEEESPPTKTKSKKSTSSKTTSKAKKTGSKSKSKSSKAEEEKEDQLSDIEVDEEGSDNDNDEIVTAKQVKPERKMVNPKTPIGDLKIDEVLSYLVQVAESSLNPQLKYGCINLINQLKGRRRRPNQPMYGSKSNRGFAPRNRGGQQFNGQQPQQFNAPNQGFRPQNRRGPIPSNENTDMYADDE